VEPAGAQTLFAGRVKNASDPYRGKPDSFRAA
jgi:hypothetical protein